MRFISEIHDYHKNTISNVFLRWWNGYEGEFFSECGGVVFSQLSINAVM